MGFKDWNLSRILTFGYAGKNINSIKKNEVGLNESMTKQTTPEVKSSNGNGKYTGIVERTDDKETLFVLDRRYSYIADGQRYELVKFPTKTSSIPAKPRRSLRVGKGFAIESKTLLTYIKSNHTYSLKNNYSRKVGEKIISVQLSEVGSSDLELAVDPILELTPEQIANLEKIQADQGVSNMKDDSGSFGVKEEEK